MHSKKRINKLQLIFTILIATYPILNQYASFVHNSIGISDFVCFWFIIYVLFSAWKNSACIVLNKEYSYFVFISVALTCLNILLVKNYSVYDVGFRVLRDLLYWAIIAIAIPNLFDIQLGFLLIKLTAFFSSLVIMLQWLIYIICHKVTFLWLPFSFRAGINKSETMEFVKSYASELYYRPSGFYTEPAYSALFCIVAVIICLFCGKKTRDIFLALFFTIGIALTTSASGILIVLVVWFLWIGNTLFKKAGKRQIIVLSFLIFISGIAALSMLLFFTPIGISLFSRLSEVSDKISRASSGYVRVLRGYDIFMELDSKNILTGTGLGNLYPYMLEHENMHKFFTLSGDRNEYVNSAAYFLNSIGVIGTVSFLIIILKRYYKENVLVKVTIIITLIIMMTDSVYNSATWILLMSIIFGSCKKIREEKR